MKPVARIAAVVTIAALALLSWQAATPAPKPLAPYFPQGALLFLEAKDFSSLLAQFNNSAEKKQWITSDNYAVFSRSRLFLRLEAAQHEFAAAAGLNPDMKFLQEAAGDRSALAIYDIGKMELLYISRLPSPKVSQGRLWEARGKFETRNAAGKQFFVRTDPESGKTVVLAVTDDYLLLATREDLMAGALGLLGGQKMALMQDESWFANSVAAAAREPGDLRMVINLEKVSRTPHFRTYWIQQNITEMQQYAAAESDLYLSRSEYREERVLLRKSGESVTGNGNAVADLLRLAPAESGFYRVQASPSVQASFDLLEQKILSPHLGPAPVEKLAPQVALGGGEVGSQSDLETRIDVPPAPRSTATAADVPLRDLLQRAQVQAVLQVESSAAASGNVFVTARTVLVFSAASNWDDASTRNALLSVARPGLTIEDLGATWRPDGKGAASYYELDGLAPISVAVHGKYLFVANDSAALSAVLRPSQNKESSQPLVYAASFNHARERDRFYHLTSLLDRVNHDSANPNAEGQQPEFFSGNIGSLSRTFAGVESEFIEVRQNGDKQFQTVRYRWR